MRRGTAAAGGRPSVAKCLGKRVFFTPFIAVATVLILRNATFATLGRVVVDGQTDDSLRDPGVIEQNGLEEDRGQVQSPSSDRFQGFAGPNGSASQTALEVTPPQTALKDASPRTALDEVLPRTYKQPYGLLDPRKKYLVYSPSGGLGNQLICLASAVLLAQELDRSLIIPMISRHLNFAKNYLAESADMMMAADRLLDLPFMADKLGIDLVPLDVGINTFIGSLDPDLVATVEIKVALKAAGVQVTRQYMQLLEAESAKRVVFFSGRFFGYQWLRYEKWAQLRFAPALQRLANMVHRQVFNGRQFNALHVRLGDTKARVLDATHDARFFADSMASIEMDPARPLYVASEAASSDFYFAPVMARATRVYFFNDLRRFQGIRRELDSLKRAIVNRQLCGMVLAILDQLICTHASMFVGSSVSTFTKTITIMRRNLNASLSAQAVDLLEVPNSQRVTASVHTDGRLHVWAWTRGGQSWHDERWFMKRSQIDRGGPNWAAGTYVF